MSFDFVYPTPLPSTKGWGPGYPNCQYAKMELDPIFRPSVHRRIHRLVKRLVRELEKRGYVFHDDWSWGFGCRGTKDSSGNESDTPSFHSWGIALDFNAPKNPFGAARENTELGKPAYAWVVKLMRAYGFFWLGPSISDWMHFSFCGSPADADKMLRKAKRNALGEPDPSYKVGARTFRVLRNAVEYIRDQLRHPRIGEELRIRIVKAS